VGFFISARGVHHPFQLLPSRRITMIEVKHTPPDQLPARDWLMTRPQEEPWPTPLDPAGPQARGYPADPNPVPKKGQGDPDETNPPPRAIGPSA